MILCDAHVLQYILHMELMIYLDSLALSKQVDSPFIHDLH